MTRSTLRLALLLVVLGAAAYATVATAQVAGVPVVVECPPAHAPFWRWAVLVTICAATLAVVLFAVRRQRTVDDDIDATVRRALARHSTSARYIYERRDGGQVVYTWDCVDDGFPLAWKTGYLIGRTMAEMLPDGPAGDEARAVYLAVLDFHTPGCYTRTEQTLDGRSVTVRYTHVPLPDGRAACEAVPLSPEIDAAVSERDTLSAEVVTLRKRLADSEERLTQRWRQMRTERAARTARATLTGGDPAPDTDEA